MQQNKKAIVLCRVDPAGNPRPKRIIHYLVENNFLVDIVGLPSRKKNINFRNYFEIIPPTNTIVAKLFRRFRYLLFKCVSIFVDNNDFLNDINNIRYGLNKIVKHIFKEKYDLVIIEDLQLLTLVKYLKKSDTKIIFDAREYYPLQYENRKIFQFLEKNERVRICEQFLTKMDHVLTVSSGLARKYKKEFGVNCKLLRSMPNYEQIEVKKTKEDEVKIVHHGKASVNRKIENMIKIVEMLDDRFTLDLYLTGDDLTISSLEKKITNFNKVKICKPVAYGSIIEMLTNYDIGLFYVEPITFNLKHCLPNKLFEYIQARLMVAVSPSPDMADLVEEYCCGVISESYSIESMAYQLNSLNAFKIDYYKNKSDKAAQILCFEQEIKKLECIF